MAKCWELRGCDEEMQGECPHSTVFDDNCPAKCAFAGCDRPTYEISIDPELIFSPDIDRGAARRDHCMSCAFFLMNGPRVER